MYGGDITDYYPELQKHLKDKAEGIKKDQASLTDIYINIIQPKNSSMNGFKGIWS